MRMLQEIAFDTPPVALAAWPGMGNVGLIAMDFLRRQLEAVPFAELDMSPFFIPDSIVVKDGLAQFPEIPTSIFHYRRNPDLIIFESNAQVTGREGITIIKTMLELLSRYHVKRIYTAAAYAQSMSFQQPSEVLLACNSPYLLDATGQDGLVPMPEGYIAGLNGLLLGVAAGQSVEAACFLGTIPQYAANIAYPKASIEIVKRFAGLLNFKIDLGELESAVSEMDQQLATIEERIKQFFPSNNENDEEIAKIDEEQVPQYVMDRIEQLFKKAEADRKFARELKKELDRWNLFELYENRFLDLFDDDRKKGKT
jgi:proteasome assembly chaperone (PAC2) family protein